MDTTNLSSSLRPGWSNHEIATARAAYIDSTRPHMAVSLSGINRATSSTHRSSYIPTPSSTHTRILI
ncbi:hypothetical protein MN608_06186 [Microdochium nivale]|nr:hypothetical protein MN608_06186 [Microdochium nivale]